MDAASAIRKIPLNKLILSPANVRKTPASAAEDAELKASLKASGLKQNLVVHASADDKGVYAVTAGGRRLKALQDWLRGILRRFQGALPGGRHRRRHRNVAHGKLLQGRHVRRR
jgi:hypothetical protein